MQPSPKWPSDLVKKNQQLLSQRQDWPAGALEACTRLMSKHPGWFVTWMPENTIPGFERPACFVAEYKHPRHQTEVTAPTIEAIDALLVPVPDHDYSMRGCDWCRARLL